MAVLYFLSYAAAAAAFVFVTLSLASGLLWIAELIEEHSKMARTVGIRLTWGIIGLLVILYFTEETLPILYILLTILCHLVYLQNFQSKTWPMIFLTSWTFMGSCILVLVNHFLWFQWFSKRSRLSRSYRGQGYGHKSLGYGQGGLGKIHSFAEIVTFFAICVWTIPLLLFLSLSANDNALPVQGTPVSSSYQQPNASLLRRVLDPLISLLPRQRQGKREGLIAPSSPISLSPLASPIPWAYQDSNAPQQGVGLGIAGTPMRKGPPAPLSLERHQSLPDVQVLQDRRPSSRRGIAKND